VRQNGTTVTVNVPYLGINLVLPDQQFFDVSYIIVGLNLLSAVQRMVFLDIDSTASEEVVMQLLKSTLHHVLLYALKACNLLKNILQSLDFTANRNVIGQTGAMTLPN